MRTVIFCAAFSLALAAPVYAQSAASTPECSSHDHPCRLGLVGVTKCQVCHAHYQKTAAGQAASPVWASTPRGESYVSPESPVLTNGSTQLSSDTRVCTACHDGLVGPSAESCPRYSMAIVSTVSTTRRMGCTVCHNPHLDNRVEEYAKFLRHEERCTDCHEGRQFEGLETDARSG